MNLFYLFLFYLLIDSKTLDITAFIEEIAFIFRSNSFIFP
jgi:hypothetical protein